MRETTNVEMTASYHWDDIDLTGEKPKKEQLVFVSENHRLMKKNDNPKLKLDHTRQYLVMCCWRWPEYLVFIDKNDQM